MAGGAAPLVAALALSPRHKFCKQTVERFVLIAGQGVAGDAHSGSTVRHRSRVKQDPTRPNLRQVHLLAAELLEELNALGFMVGQGDLGENVLTCGLDLLALPRGTLLRFPSGACVQVTGLRNPCGQIEEFRPGLLAHMVSKQAGGAVMRRAGVMAIDLVSGEVGVGDKLEVVLPELPHCGLEVV